MTAISDTSSFESVKSIALLCTEIDDAWYESIKGIIDINRQALAVAECSRKLKQISQYPIQCVGVVFGNIKLEGKRSGSHPRLEVYHQQSITIKLPSTSFAPSDKEMASFYILHDRALWSIQLDPHSNKVLILDNPEKVIPSPTVSSREVAALTHQRWNGCFISAKSPTMKVIPMPTV